MNALTERLGRLPFISNEDKRKINLSTSKKKKTMKTLVIHEDLKKRLKLAASNGSVVAKDVLKAAGNGKETNANANYFTSVRKKHTSSEDGVGVYSIKITCCNKDIENPNFPDLGRKDAQWLKHNRCELSVGSFIDQFGLRDYCSDDITYFASALGCASKIHLELISSEQDMEKAYNMENYSNMRQYSELSATLHHSCMRYEGTAKNAADFYHNFAGAKMLIAKGEDGLIYGRCIIWRNVESEEYDTPFTLIERVYCCYDFIYTMMMRWAEKNVDLRKRENSYTCTREFIALRDLAMEKDNITFYKGAQLNLNIHIKVPQLKWHKAGVPYMDTFYMICYYQGNLYISNHEIGGCAHVADCRETTGYAYRSGNICPVCGKVHSTKGLCSTCQITYFVTNEFGSFYKNTKGFVKYKDNYVLREMMHNGKPNRHFQAMLNTDKLFG